MRAGIAYQLVPDDPLIDTTQCGLDSALMKTIGANSIRVYHVDPDADHTDCMKTFADAGSTYITGMKRGSPLQACTDSVYLQGTLRLWVQLTDDGPLILGWRKATALQTHFLQPYHG
jgi:hypothetical protein